MLSIFTLRNLLAFTEVVCPVLDRNLKLKAEVLGIRKGIYVDTIYGSQCAKLYFYYFNIVKSKCLQV